MHKLDSIVSPRDQARWLKDLTFAPQGNSRVYVESNPKYVDRVRRFRERDDFDAMLVLLANYVRLCIPYSRETAPDFWSCNLFLDPSYAYSRINIGGQETFSVYMHDLQVGWTLHDDVEKEVIDLPSFLESLGIGQTSVERWGEGRITIWLDLEAAGALLENPEWCLLTRAANHFLMGRINNWRRHHNYALAQAIDDFIRNEWHENAQYLEDITGFPSVQLGQYDEGQLQLRSTLLRRRSRALVQEAIARQRQQENGVLKCRVCGFEAPTTTNPSTWSCAAGKACGSGMWTATNTSTAFQPTRRSTRGTATRASWRP
jgi:hypothetical protein